MHVRGYQEEGSTTTPFDMVVRNRLDRFHLVGDVIDRVAKIDNSGVYMALSHCQIAHATNLLARWAHAAATTSCHVCMADALKARCVLAEVRWRWTLKVL
jgi:XFP C-terminal domain